MLYAQGLLGGIQIDACLKKVGVIGQPDPRPCFQHLDTLRNEIPAACKRLSHLLLPLNIVVAADHRGQGALYLRQQLSVTRFLQPGESLARGADAIPIEKGIGNGEGAVHRIAGSAVALDDRTVGEFLIDVGTLLHIASRQVHGRQCACHTRMVVPFGRLRIVPGQSDFEVVLQGTIHRFLQ